MGRSKTPPNEVDQESTRLLTLLQEYTGKLNAIVEKAPNDPPAREQVRRRGRRIVPAARKLAQFASQRLTWSEDALLNLELELRLAEFETALAAFLEL